MIIKYSGKSAEAMMLKYKQPAYYWFKFFLTENTPDKKWADASKAYWLQQLGGLASAW
jgi:hypothetical protein